MAIVSTVKSFTGSVSWDDEWANREGSGSGYLWKVIPNTGVNIMDSTSLTTTIEFLSEGNYTLEFYASDGAVCSKATKTITIGSQDGSGSGSGLIDVALTNNNDLVVPLHVTLPLGTAIFRELDCLLDVDYSGSMGGVMNNLKVYAQEIVSALFSGGKDVKCAISKFGCLGASPELHIYNDLSDQMDVINSSINSLSPNSYGSQELQYYSIETNCRSISWRPKSLMIYALFSDEEAEAINSTYDMALSSLKDHNIKFIGMDSSSSGYGMGYLNSLGLATGGGSYNISNTSSSVIVDAISSAVDKMSTNLTVKMTPVGAPNGLVKSIIPNQHDGINPGDSFDFRITFNRSGLPAGSGSQVFRFNLEMIASDVALVDSVPVDITVKWS